MIVKQGNLKRGPSRPCTACDARMGTFLLIALPRQKSDASNGGPSCQLHCVHRFVMGAMPDPVPLLARDATARPCSARVARSASLPVGALHRNAPEVWPRGLRYWFAKSVRQEDAERNVVRFHGACLIAPLYPDAPLEQSVDAKLRGKCNRKRSKAAQRDARVRDPL